MCISDTHHFVRDSRVLESQVLLQKNQFIFFTHPLARIIFQVIYIHFPMKSCWFFFVLFRMYFVSVLLYREAFVKCTHMYIVRFVLRPFVRTPRLFVGDVDEPFLYRFLSFDPQRRWNSKHKTCFLDDIATIQCLPQEEEVIVVIGLCKLSSEE